eukprot:scaffold80557_cov31-Tisochrysis_lutea.AAC.2
MPRHITTAGVACCRPRSFDISPTRGILYLGEFRVWNLRTLGDWHPCSTRTLGRRAARACARSVDCLMQPLSQLQQPLHSAQQLRALLHLPAALNLVS